VPDALERLKATLVVLVVPVRDRYDRASVNDNHLTRKLIAKDVLRPLPRSLTPLAKLPTNAGRHGRSLRSA
jgi:hypothetical protein